MRTRSEDRKREKLSRACLLVSLFSLVPVAGIALSPAGILLCLSSLYLARRFPEKVGGLVRIRVSLVVALAGLALAAAETHVFVRIKRDQAFEARRQLTVMRLYEAADALENYEKANGVYPEGGSAADVFDKLNREGSTVLPFKDGWDRDLKVSSRMWDYSLSALAPPEGKGTGFPVLEAQDPKPVFPYVGPTVEWNGQNGSRGPVDPPSEGQAPP